tara:strand:- start:378 stop:959 length:582 start_codon:yes stop_codon:yes gene_type:complete
MLINHHHVYAYYITKVNGDYLGQPVHYWEQIEALQESGAILVHDKTLLSLFIAWLTLSGQQTKLSTEIKDIDVAKRPYSFDSTILPNVVTTSATPTWLDIFSELSLFYPDKGDRVTVLAPLDVNNQYWEESGEISTIGETSVVTARFDGNVKHYRLSMPILSAVVTFDNNKGVLPTPFLSLKFTDFSQSEMAA